MAATALEMDGSVMEGVSNVNMAFSPFLFNLFFY